MTKSETTQSIEMEPEAGAKGIKCRELNMIGKCIKYIMSLRLVLERASK